MPQGYARGGVDFTRPVQPQLRLQSSAATAVATATDQAVAFDTEIVDSHGQHDNVTNNSRATCKSAGFYVMSACIRWEDVTTGARILSLRVNGTTLISRQFTQDNGQYQVIATAYPLAVGDYIEVIARQTSGASKNVEVAANYSPQFAWAKVSD